MRPHLLLLILLSCPALDALPGQRARALPYRDARLSSEARVRDLLGRMTREEKFWQLYMAPGDLDEPRDDYSHGIFGLQIRISDTTPNAPRRHAEKINAVQRYFVERTRLGIPIIPFEEALHGVLAHNATVFPQAIALAATWDTALVRDVATAIAREARSRGIRDVLSPVVNIASDVRWGRVEETYGEDPWLSSRMAVAYVAPIEAAGVVTTPKHFVANVGDGGRDSYPIHLDTRLLEELHFPPFRAAIQEGGARSLMTAYNSVAGVPATQNRWLLTDKLKSEWGFSGFVISDASATSGATVLHMTEPSTATAVRRALHAGLDVVFQGGRAEAMPYRETIVRGTVADSVLDAAVRRVLRVKFALGLFERPYADPESASHWNDHPAHRDLALRAARESIVLLRNEGRALPLTSAARRIAVIGVDAAESRFGGYSGSNGVRVSLLDGIRARGGPGLRVRYEPGPGRGSMDVTPIPASHLAPLGGSTGAQGLRGEYFGNIALTGTPALVRTDPQVDFAWTLTSPGRGISLDWYSARWTGTLTAPRGITRIGVEGTDGYRLYVDDTLRLDRWRSASAGLRLAPMRFAAGPHTIRLEFFVAAGRGRVRLVWDAARSTEWRSRIDEAIAAARASDVAIVAAGLEEGEFRDRASLALPGHQEALISDVAATGTPTIVVLVGGSAVTMSRWIDSVAAVVSVWYPGAEGGRALADVLWGDVNPAGRLPVTFPVAEGQLPLTYNHRPTGRGDDYLDLSGAPLFPFGFGLSYTTFEYSDLRIEPDTMKPHGMVTVRCVITNTGSRAGDEVAQLYIRDLLASTARPVMQLEGFRRLHLAPGESREVAFRIAAAQLRMLDERGRWMVEPGTFRIMVGSSSKDIRLRGELIVR